MSTLRYFSMLAAMSLVGAAYAQTQAPPDQTTGSSSTSSQESQHEQATRPSSASSPHQRDVTPQSSQSTTEAPPTGAAPTQSSEPAAASTPHQQSATRMAEAGHAGNVSPGMAVQSRSGESLGTVIDIIADPATDAQYVVIATSGGSAAPVPMSTANSMVVNGKLVMDKSRLDKAPKVQQGQAQDRSGGSWQKKADSYWGGKSSDHARSNENSTSPDSSSERMKNHPTSPDSSDQMPKSPQ